MTANYLVRWYDAENDEPGQKEFKSEGKAEAFAERQRMKGYDAEVIYL